MISSSSETLRPIKDFILTNSNEEVIRQNIPYARTPINCVVKLWSELKRPTANVPQIPQTKWTETAPTGSSIFDLSKNITIYRENISKREAYKKAMEVNYGG